MYRFSEAMYNPDIQTVDIGVGLTWENVCVVSGRVSGVGVAELTLGGGSFCYLWTPAGKSVNTIYMSQVFKTNQYGIAIDTLAVTTFELVNPNGNVAMATKASRSELVFLSPGLSI